MTRRLGILLIAPLLCATVGCRTCNGERYRLFERCSTTASAPAQLASNRVPPEYAAPPTGYATPTQVAPMPQTGFGSYYPPVTGYPTSGFGPMQFSPTPGGTSFAPPPATFAPAPSNQLPLPSEMLAPPNSSGQVTPPSSNGMFLPTPIPIGPTPSAPVSR